MRNEKPNGLTLRGDIWWININRRLGGRLVKIRESTGCRAEDLAGAVAVRDRRIEEATGYIPPIPLADGERKLADAAAEYVLDLERRGKNPTRALQDIRMILTEAGDWPLSHVHQRTLQPWIDAQKGKRASGTVARALQTLSTVLRFAAQVLRDGHAPWLSSAPPRLRAPDWGARPRRPITWEEQDRLVAELPDYLRPPALFAVYTGARQHEVVTLKWDSFRAVSGLPEWSCAWIPPDIRKASSRATLSERDGRMVVCPRAARAVIEGQLGKDPEWVFPSPKRPGERLFKLNSHGWRSAVARAGLSGMREHDLRHTFGDRAADAGLSETLIAALLGHRRGSVTARYSRPGLSRLLAEAERIVRPETTKLRVVL
jgi:integrase